VALRLQRSMPRLGHGSVRGGWAGLLEGTPDFHPILGPVPGVEGFLLCCGFSGHGFKEAPVNRPADRRADPWTDGRVSISRLWPTIASGAGALLRSSYRDDPIMA